MTLRDKVERLIIGLGLTSTKFADIIGVKRPIISHILSGRNNTSLEIIQKIVGRFPELGFNWISDDEDLDMVIIQEITKNQKLNELSSNIGNSRELNGLNSTEDDLEIFNSQGLGKSKFGSKKIDYVMVFYTDSTVQKFDAF